MPTQYPQYNLSKEERELFKQMAEAREKRQKLIALGEQLKFPVSYDKDNQPVVTVEALWAVLSDETKRKELLSRLNLKAFW
jgi:hypothetical protein